MGKIFFLSVFLVLLISCKEDKDQTAEEGITSFDISTEGWSKKTVLNSSTTEIIKDWETFNALQTSFDAIYNVGNTEDLSLVLEDLIEKQKNLSESIYPEPIDKPQIKSRQKVFHTFMLKTKGDLIYSIDVQESVSQMIAAYNAMLTQMNVITSNTLDLKTLLEAEVK
jgi:hypothetical protein